MSRCWRGHRARLPGAEVRAAQQGDGVSRRRRFTVALLLATLVSTRMAILEKRQSDRAERGERAAIEAEQTMEEQREFAEAHAYAADMNLAQQALAAG
jgi:hypothetical protein